MTKLLIDVFLLIAFGQQLNSMTQRNMIYHFQLLHVLSTLKRKLFLKCFIFVSEAQVVDT